MLQVPPEIYHSFVAAVDKRNIRTMPNRSMPAAPYPTPGALLMGDAFNMRHPLTGGGMTVALSDIVVLRDLLKPLHDLNNASALCNYLESFYTLRKVCCLFCYSSCLVGFLSSTTILSGCQRKIILTKVLLSLDIIQNSYVNLAVHHLA